MTTREEMEAKGLTPAETQHSGHRRARWHDYALPGIYMLTLVIEGRHPLFGTIEGRSRAAKDSADYPHLHPSPFGKKVLEEEVLKISRCYKMVEVWKVALMPDHVHLLVCVREPLPKGRHLGHIVSGFKAGCTQAWWKWQDEQQPALGEGGGRAGYNGGGGSPGEGGDAGDGGGGGPGDDGGALGRPFGHGNRGPYAPGEDSGGAPVPSVPAPVPSFGAPSDGGGEAPVPSVPVPVPPFGAPSDGGDGAPVPSFGARGEDSGGAPVPSVLVPVPPFGAPSEGGDGAPVPSFGALSDGDGALSEGGGAPVSVAPSSSVTVPEGSPEGSRPSEGSAGRRPVLFERGYHDRIVRDADMLGNIRRYMDENPFRARLRAEIPHLMQRRLHLWISDREYAAFGNLFLLKNPERVQVFFHRKDAAGRPTHLTPEYAAARDRLLQRAEEGAVLVTPGISKGERGVVDQALVRRLPLIILQKEPISAYWKPAQSRFYACAAGHLLILAPWQLDGESDYTRFHALNDLARAICIASDTRLLGLD